MITPMRRFLLAILTVALLLSLAPDAGARSRKKRAAIAAKAGAFDYYLLSLSWSPEYCAGPNGGRDTQQCGSERRFGFVVHGLWPQYEHGYPQACGTAAPVPSSIVNTMLPLMPSPRLIEHEWQTHGTCSGLDVNAYFEKIQKAFATVRIPDDFKSPVSQIEVSPADIKTKFGQANPSFPPDAFRVQCGGRYLSEVRACLTKDLAGRACSSDVRDTCRDDTIIMRPLR
jgi:ribonuclease T2